MKNITKLMLLPALLLSFLFSSCEKDTDSNPTLGPAPASFQLNTPAYAANNTYDLINSESVELTCTQPDYGGGVPYTVRYYVQVSIDNTFAEDTYTELSTSYTSAKMNVSAYEMNDALVTSYRAAHPGELIPDAIPVYVRLRAVIDGGNDAHLGETFSNVITLPSAHIEYQAPDAVLPDNLYVIGSSIQNSWSSWKPVAQLAGIKGSYFTVVYVPAGGQFKWGTAEGDYRDYTALTSVTDNANAGIACNEMDYNNIQVANAGWYTLFFTGEITPDGKDINYALTVYPAEAYIASGTITGADWGFNDAWKLTAPADASSEWVSPAFAAAGELRVSVKIPGVDWYRSEFTILNGSLYFGNPTDNWATNFGSEYSVSVQAGQKLYVNFDMNTAEVR